MKKIFTILLISLCGCAKTQIIVDGAKIYDELPNRYLIVMWGESNEGAFALNTDATAYELSPRNSVKILHNNTFLFETLDIGTNNTIGHYSAFGELCCTTHGWELALANAVDSNHLRYPAYIVKAGQGGSQIVSWLPNQVPFWDSITRRVDTAVKLLTALNEGIVPRIYMWGSIGINDNGSDTAVWKTRMETFISSFRARYSQNIPFFLTYIPVAFPNFAYINTAIDRICAETTECYPIETAGLIPPPGFHWDYIREKVVSQRFIAAMKLHYGL